MMAEERDFDVFVSHASEDEDTVVRPLEQAYRPRLPCSRSWSR